MKILIYGSTLKPVILYFYNTKAAGLNIPARRLKYGIFRRTGAAGRDVCIYGRGFATNSPLRNQSGALHIWAAGSFLYLIFAYGTALLYDKGKTKYRLKLPHCHGLNKLNNR